MDEQHTPRYRCLDEYRQACGYVLWQYELITHAGNHYCQFCRSSVAPDDGIPMIPYIFTEVRLPMEVQP